MFFPIPIRYIFFRIYLFERVTGKTLERRELYFLAHCLDASNHWSRANSKLGSKNTFWLSRVVCRILSTFCSLLHYRCVSRKLDWK